MTRQIRCFSAAFAVLFLVACGGSPTPPINDVACPAGDRYVVRSSGLPGAAAALESTVESAGGAVLVDLAEIGARVVCAPAGARSSMEAAGVQLQQDGRASIPPGESILPVRHASIAAVVGQWHLAKVGAPAAWAVSQGRDVTIVIVDTGADGRHAGLRDRIIGGTNYTGGRPCGADLDCDGHGHGTHVAATAAETLDSGQPPDIAGGTGIAPRAGLYISKALDDWGSGWSSDIARAILDAGNNAASGQRTVISMSLGASQPDAAIRDAIGYATRAGALVVAARGNGSGTSPSWPACFEPVVGVAATGQDDRRAGFSDYGDCTDIAAPGAGIVAAVPGGGYAAMDGTSMSTPQVAGALALLMALGDRDPIVTLMMTSVDVVDSTIPGRLDVAAAVRGVRPGPTATGGPTSPDYVVTSEPTHNPYPGPGTATWSPTPIPPPSATRAATITRTTIPTARPTNTSTPTTPNTPTLPPVIATQTRTRTTAPTATRTGTPTATPTPCSILAWTRVGNVNGFRLVPAFCPTPTVRR